MLSPGLFLLDELVDEPWDGPAANTPGRLRPGAVRISHEPEVKGLLGADVIVIVKSDLAAFAALKVFRHSELLLYLSTLEGTSNFLTAAILLVGLFAVETEGLHHRRVLNGE